jgi:ankyrin repeat protein
MDRRKSFFTPIHLFSLALLLISVFFLTGCQGIQSAARDGNIDHIKTLLAFGANIDDTIWFKDQGTALHWAADAGQTETVEFLIEKGADVNVESEASESPLFYAARSGHADIVKLLLENGAYVSGTESGRGDKVPLVLAAGNGHLEAVKILVSHNADINQKGMMECSALHNAVGRQPPNIELIRFLISKGADVNTEAAYESRPLFRAVCNGDIELVNLLIDAGAEVNVTANGSTHLNVSGINGDVKMTELLLTRGANVNTPDKHRNTPLFIAYCRKNIEIGRILLKHGAKWKLAEKDKTIPQSFIDKLRQ